MNRFLEVAIDAAREAGAILRADFNRPKKISYKDEVDIVTESDHRSEALLVARLRSCFPDHAIVAEEGSNGAAAASAKYCWHVDPLDGTTNFAHGYPCFAVSLGLLEQGQPIVAAVLNPLSEELFTAVRGQGAYLNQKRIHGPPNEKLAHSLVATGFPTRQLEESRNINYYWEFTLRSHGVRRDGSAALDLCSVACGRFDAFVGFGRGHASRHGGRRDGDRSFRPALSPGRLRYPGVERARTCRDAANRGPNRRAHLRLEIELLVSVGWSPESGARSRLGVRLRFALEASQNRRWASLRRTPQQRKRKKREDISNEF